jgi:hypothetical protein
MGANIPLLPVFVRIAKIPASVMATVTVAILVVGAYSLNGNTFDVGVTLIAGLAGFLLRTLGIPEAPPGLRLHPRPALRDQRASPVAVALLIARAARAHQRCTAGSTQGTSAARG